MVYMYWPTLSLISQSSRCNKLAMNIAWIDVAVFSILQLFAHTWSTTHIHKSIKHHQTTLRFHFHNHYCRSFSIQFILVRGQILFFFFGFSLGDWLHNTRFIIIMEYITYQLRSCKKFVSLVNKWNIKGIYHFCLVRPGWWCVW